VGCLAATRPGQHMMLGILVAGYGIYRSKM